MSSICIFKLQDNKYYVTELTSEHIRQSVFNKGRKNESDDEFLETVKMFMIDVLIKNLNNVEWLKKYPVVDIEKIHPVSSIFDEDKWTKDYMFKYGIDNVRGSFYQDIVLEDYIIDNIDNELNKFANKDKNNGMAVKKFFKIDEINDTVKILFDVKDIIIKTNNIYIQYINYDISKFNPILLNSFFNIIEKKLGYNPKYINFLSPNYDIENYMKMLDELYLETNKITPGCIKTDFNKIKNIIYKSINNNIFLHNITEALFFKYINEKLIIDFGNLFEIETKINKLLLTKLKFIQEELNKINISNKIG
jgi:hypothetical protein